MGRLRDRQLHGIGIVTSNVPESLFQVVRYIRVPAYCTDHRIDQNRDVRAGSRREPDRTPVRYSPLQSYPGDELDVLVENWTFIVIRKIQQNTSEQWLRHN